MMKRNALRIVCNPGTNRISYYFRNELSEWMILSGSSPLSRQAYTKTTIKERCKEILEKIDEVYNRKNKGVDIYYEGTPDGFECLRKSIDEYLPDRNLVCKQRITQIAVVGKKKSGKSFLIGGIEDFQQSKFKKKERTGYTEYIDSGNNVSWFEVNGIDFSTDSINSVVSTIRKIQKNDLSCLIYCVSGISGRMEEAESKLLRDLKNEFPGVTIIIVVTMCYKNDARDICDEIEKMVDHIEIFPVLAKDYMATARGKKHKQNLIIKSFGIDILYTYIFEGKKVRRIYRSKSFCNEFEKENTDNSDMHINKRNHVINDTILTDKKKETLNNGSEKIIDDINADNIYRKVIVVGKIAAGKTTLIEGIEAYLDVVFKYCDGDGTYSVFEDETNKIKWYEVNGIDLGIKEADQAFNTVTKLASNGVDFLIYCISAETGRVEDIEKELIRRIVDEKITTIIVLTMCCKEDLHEIVETISNISNEVSVMQILAKEYHTGVKNPVTGRPLKIDAFGVNELCERLGIGI